MSQGRFGLFWRDLRQLLFLPKVFLCAFCARNKIHFFKSIEEIGKKGRALDSANQAQYNRLDPALPRIDRFKRIIGGHQANLRRFPVKTLQRGLLPIQHGHHQLAVLRGGLPMTNYIIAVPNPRPGHTVSAHPEHKQFTRIAEKLLQRKGLAVFEGLNPVSGRHHAGQRNRHPAQIAVAGSL